VDPTSAEDHERVLHQATADQPLAGVISFHGLDAAARETSAQEAVSEAVDACERLLHIVGAMAGLAPGDGGHRPRLWIVTRGAALVPDEAAGSVPGNTVAPTQAALWGAGRSVAVEHRALWGGAIDLDPAGDDPVGDLAACWPMAATEDELAARVGRVLAPRLQATPELAADAALTPADDGTYLVTGGTGGLGMQVAGRLVDRGARSIVLVSRRGVVPETARELVATWRNAGVTVVVEAADVADADAVAEVIGRIDAGRRPLRGVVHAAGVLDDGILQKLDRSRIESVCRPKIGGAVVLDQLTRERDLDFVILFSSLAALVGAAGQANYAAASACLDAFAARQTRPGRPTLAVNWGLWDGDGLGARLGARHRESLAAQGFTPLSALEGGRTFDQVLGRTGSVVVARADWVVCAAGRPWSSVLGRYRTGVAGRGGGRSAGWLAHQLRQSPVSDRLEVLRDAVRAQVAAVLRTETADVPVEKGFFDQGMDSLLAMELRTRLEAALDTSLSPTVTFDHPTTERLVAHLSPRVGVVSPARPARPDSPDDADSAGSAPGQLADGASDTLTEIRGLSTEELEALIDREVDALL